MDKGTQVEMSLDSVLDAVIAEIGQEALSFYHPSRDFIITENAVSIEESKKITLD